MLRSRDALLKARPDVIDTASSLGRIAVEPPSERRAAERSRLKDLGMMIRERTRRTDLSRDGRAFFFRDLDGGVSVLIAANARPGRP